MRGRKLGYYKVAQRRSEHFENNVHTITTENWFVDDADYVTPVRPAQLSAPRPRRKTSRRRNRGWKRLSSEQLSVFLPKLIFYLVLSMLFPLWGWYRLWKDTNNMAYYLVTAWIFLLFMGLFVGLIALGGTYR